MECLQRFFLHFEVVRQIQNTPGAQSYGIVRISRRNPLRLLSRDLIHFLFRKPKRCDNLKFSIKIIAPSRTLSEKEGVQDVSLALGHDEPVSVGCPLYNEASAVKSCLVLSSNVIAQGLD